MPAGGTIAAHRNRNESSARSFQGRLMEELKVRRLAVINKSKRMVGILSLGDVSHSAAPGNLLSEWVRSVSAHH